MFAGIAMCLIGLSLLFVSPYKIWQVTEKWKTAEGKKPSKSFVIITKVLGILFAAAGVYLLVAGL